MTKLQTLSEIATASVISGAYTYLGTNKGNIYRMVNATGAITLLTSLDEATDHGTSTNQSR